MQCRYLLLLCLVLLSFVSCSSSVRRRRRIWRKREITWKFRDPNGIIESEETFSIIRSLISTTFSMWEMALKSKLKINEDMTDNLTDIDIYFARGDHGDIEALDGPGGIVAHSGLPPRGYLHLDADEQWSFDGINGIDLRYVILHETGHLLGLRHTRIPSAIMNPFYRNLKNGLILSLHDVQSIQKLYSDIYLTSKEKLLKL